MDPCHDRARSERDATLYELAGASGRRIEVDPLKIFVSEETRKICSLFRLDPLTTLSEGTLIITCSKKNTNQIQRKLSRAGIQSYIVGEVVKEGPSGLWLVGNERRAKRYLPPYHDQYWDAYSRAVKKGWR